MQIFSTKFVTRTYGTSCLLRGDTRAFGGVMVLDINVVTFI